jgi:hypothetical protein
MAEYTVVWKIDIEANSPREAAELALKIQRDKKSTATVFDVAEFEGSDDDYEMIDLSEEV